MLEFLGFFLQLLVLLLQVLDLRLQLGHRVRGLQIWPLEMRAPLFPKQANLFVQGGNILTVLVFIFLDYDAQVLVFLSQILDFVLPVAVDFEDLLDLVVQLHDRFVLFIQIPDPLLAVCTARTLFGEFIQGHL